MTDESPTAPAGTPATPAPVAPPPPMPPIDLGDLEFRGGPDETADNAKENDRDTR
jgi:hypothetical protein